MGSMHAQEFAGMVADGEVEIDAALRWHLTSNHFPPLPIELLGPAKAAIALADAEDWDTNIVLPEGISYRGSRTAPVSACVAAWHLDAFLTQGDPDEEFGDVWS